MKKKKKKFIEGRHITNVEYQEFEDVYYYITYPGVKPNLYGISLYGDIMSLKKNREKKRKQDICTHGHYARVALRTTSDTTRTFMINRLVAWEFVGQPEDYYKLQVNHADGVHLNNYYKNLEWTTSMENGIHKALYGLSASGDNHGWSNHPEYVVRFVIDMINNGYTAPLIAKATLKMFPDIYDSSTKKDYDRIRGLVSKINRGVSWYKVKDEMEGSTTIEHVIYEKHIGEEVSRVGLHPCAAQKNGELYYR